MSTIDFHSTSSLEFLTIKCSTVSVKLLIIVWKLLKIYSLETTVKQLPIISHLLNLQVLRAINSPQTATTGSGFIQGRKIRPNKIYCLFRIYLPCLSQALLLLNICGYLQLNFSYPFQQTV